MDLIDYIERLRNKPEMTRRRILVGATFSITAAIFFFWLSVRLYDAGSSTASVAKIEETGPIKEVISSVGSFIDLAGKKIESVKQMILATTTATTTLP